MQIAHSLVRYDNPVLVSRIDAAAKAALKNPAASSDKKATGAQQQQQAGVTGTATGQPNNTKKLPPVDDKGRVKTPTQTEDILNSILPPRY